MAAARTLNLFFACTATANVQGSACRVSGMYQVSHLSRLRSPPLLHTTAMAPIDQTHRVAAHILARSAVAYLAQRDLTVKGAQGVTLGVIAAYVVGIAILWNIPYVKYVLWPFKVRVVYLHKFWLFRLANCCCRCLSSPSTNSRTQPPPAALEDESNLSPWTLMKAA